MSTENLKELRNALSCWQDDYDRDHDKEQYDMFGAAIDAVSRLEAAERANSAQSFHINQQQDRIDSLEQKNAALGNALGTAERERDDLRAIAEDQSKLAGINAARAQKAEAELARRDAAAGEPVAIVREVINGIHVSLYQRIEPGTELYTAAPPAVLPPNVMNHLSDAANTVSEWTHGDEHSCKVNRTALIAAVQALGAKPQKVVELPEPERHREPGIVVGMYESFVVYKALDAANVKWEVKK
ncbi:hypothetical protein VRB95_11125 [Erwinia aphidicola]|uniref:hypothetical protein n=1 Tax=Erwinia aphidicola TaxID=68334 RepID=UPI0030D38E9F